MKNALGFSDLLVFVSALKFNFVTPLILHLVLDSMATRGLFELAQNSFQHFL